jgi:hypothetical protein
MKRTFLTACGLSLFLAAGAAQASTVVINFDDLAPGVTLTDQYAALGVTFSANVGGPLADLSSNATFGGYGWATNTDMTVASLDATISKYGDVTNLPGFAQLASGNILGSFDVYWNRFLDGDASFQLTFSTAINSFSALFVGVNADYQDVTLWAYDGTALVTQISGSQSLPQFTLSLTAPNITSVVVRPGNVYEWVGVDNITFNTIDSVPEPSTSAMLALGLALIAATRRKTH